MHAENYWVFPEKFPDFAYQKKLPFYFTCVLGVTGLAGLESLFYT
jgi:hypothetical protein